MTPLDDPLALERRAGLPDALRVLAEAFPRAKWEQHPNFGDMVQFWLQRHAMFRQLSEVLSEDVEAHLDGKLSYADYAPRLARYCGLMLQELHTHHHVEDSHYFPQLIRLEARLEQGFDLLERDHGAMDGLLHDMATSANMVLQKNADPAAAVAFSKRLAGFSRLLERHLTDEEDIVVPVILKSGFSG